jgi:hypothetical protein
MDRPALSALPVALALAALAVPASAEPPPELGRVAWQRDYAAARAEARRSGRPLLVLFDEVPGCQTVLAYGRGPLSDPRIVRIAAEAFVAVAVYNNVGGADRAVLNRYREPTWNNPVVRVVDADERALAPRLAGDYSLAGLARNLAAGLEAAGRPKPEALVALLAEVAPATR